MFGCGVSFRPLMYGSRAVEFITQCATCKTGSSISLIYFNRSGKYLVMQIQKIMKLSYTTCFTASLTLD